MLGAGARRDVFLLHALRHRRPVPAVLPRAAGRRRGAGPARRQRGCQGQAYFRIANVAHSPDHKLIAYAVDNKGSELYTVQILEAATGAIIDNRIADNNGSFVWAPTAGPCSMSGSTPSTAPSRSSATHRRQADQMCSSTRSDPGFFLGLGETQDRRLPILSVHDHQTTEVCLIDAEILGGAAPRRAARARPRVCGRAPRRPAHHHHQLRRRGGLPHRRGAAGASLARALARDRSPRPGRLILEIVAFKDHLVRLEREDGLPRIVVRRFADGAEHAIAFDEEAYSLGISRWLRVRHRRRCASPIRR